jgi:hypothetical protein
MQCFASSYNFSSSKANKANANLEPLAIVSAVTTGCSGTRSPDQASLLMILTIAISKILKALLTATGTRELCSLTSRDDEVSRYKGMEKRVLMVF